uniref:NADH-ubiquinone oxidoreductase chain 5 n=1 Tax=Armadillidium nasatum TaxID=96803 RepID=A0A343F036_9CRUS|nr:NADH dehydrogenase subunit 5 [Armadillidium nasatum]
MSLFLYLVSIIFLIFSLNFVMLNYSVMFEWEIFSTAGKIFLFNFYVDWMSAMFFSFVALISGSVLYFSGSYMPMDKSLRKFMFMVFVFVLSMFFMVFSLNLVSMMLGWDGLGIISYILVVFYNNDKSNSAGMLTVMSNRVGDAALLLSIACFMEMSSWNYLVLNIHLDWMMSALVILAAMTKSAQIPFSAWLPAAMAAPTPVSALVHSSTLVTAGVYLLIRFSNLMQCFSILSLLIYLGVLTTLMASLSALFEPDLKKVVALSTLSQLGIMMSTLALGFSELAFIHLLTHAVFKALLFMCSGKIIHNVGGYQDTRKMGGEMFNLPVTSMIMVLSSYALCGVPFLAGFYSKDLIIEASLMGDMFFMNYCLYMLSVGLSTSYSFRLLFMSMVGPTNQSSYISSDEEDWIMLISKMFLLMLSLVSGAFLLWVCIPNPWMVSLVAGSKWLSFTSLLLGMVLGVWLCFWNTKGLWFSSMLTETEVFMTMWNLPKISGMKLSFSSMYLSLSFSKLDLGWVEVFGGFGLYNLLSNKGSFLEGWKLNNIKNILIVFILSLVFLEIWV